MFVAKLIALMVGAIVRLFSAEYTSGI